MYKEIEGNLIEMGLAGQFDVISHGCNCFCNMGAGLAVGMAKTFKCDKFQLEAQQFKGDVNKLGCIDYKLFQLDGFHPPKFVAIVNSYTQYHYGAKYKPLDIQALTLCMRKINHTFKGKKIGLPKIGAGLAAGNWDEIKTIIQAELKDCDVTVVIFKP